MTFRAVGIENQDVDFLIFHDFRSLLLWPMQDPCFKSRSYGQVRM